MTCAVSSHGSKLLPVRTCHPFSSSMLKVYNDSAKPVQHAPQRGQVALRNKIKDTLEELHSAGLIEPVSKPMPWILSMLAVPKKNGKIRISLDPKDLNKAILWENYSMPTKEDIATRLHGTRECSILDAKNGFWHVKLDKESLHLTTFHTPFGRFRWCRMPFGISSAPEVFQCRMHELTEGLSWTEVVADVLETPSKRFSVVTTKTLLHFCSGVPQVVSSLQWKSFSCA